MKDGLQPVETATITILADNVIDNTTVDTGPARRLKQTELDPSAFEAPLTVQGHTRAALQAHHGFAALVSVERQGQRRSVLFDTGGSADGVAHNMKVLGVPTDEIEAIVFSHGHYDHTMGLHGLTGELGGRNLPVVVHPDYWKRRRMVTAGSPPREMPQMSRLAMEGAGFRIVEETGPSLLLDGALMVTGQVERTTDFEHGMPGLEAWTEGNWTPDPMVLDDQSLVLHIEGKGIAVITGCGHAGAINIATYARRLTGVAEIHMLIGGFHLGGTVTESVRSQTVEALKDLAPRWIVPMHCTGWQAIYALSQEMPEAFIMNSVGTRYEL